MDELTNLILAFTFSFIGSIPPGSLNISMIQLGLEHRMDIAWRFALAVAIIEYPYAWIAIEFENLLSSASFIKNNFQLITGIVMLILGAFNLWSAQKPTEFSRKFNESGFRRGPILSILNPLALPFWIGITAYLRSLQWIDLSERSQIHTYLLGVSLGAFSMLLVMAYLAKRLVGYFKGDSFIKNVPGVSLLLLGVYALLNYLYK